MKKAILGTKVGMTQVFDEKGIVTPVTVVEAGPCVVLQHLTAEHDGYEALRVGYDVVREKLLTKPEKGQFTKVGAPLCRTIREFKLDDCSAEIGSEIKADVFAAGERVDVSGISRGHGYSGPIKRWNQHRGPMAHGSKYHRGVGSMSANSSPSRVFKNKHMAGQYGSEKVTIQNLTVVRVDVERNLMLIKGAVPGVRGTLLVIRDAVKQ